MASFQPKWAFCPQPADLGRFMATFQPLTQSMMRGMSSTCRPWQVDGQFSALWSQPADLGRLTAGFQPPWTSSSQPADLGRFMATFQPLLKVAINLPTLEGWWPLSSTCQPWQVHGRFSAPTKSGHKPADLGRLMATFWNCHIWLVCPSEWMY